MSTEPEPTDENGYPVYPEGTPMFTGWSDNQLLAYYNTGMSSNPNVKRELVRRGLKPADWPEIIE